MQDVDRLNLADARQDLRADCSRCQGLCCVAPAFARSADFAIDKPAGHACPHLRTDFLCSIHADLRDRGFPGCTVFDCFGAGQQVVQVTFAGNDWRQAPETASSVFEAFGVMRHLKETLWYLAEALAALPPGPLREEVRGVQTRIRAQVDGSAQDLERIDPAAHRAQVGPLLAEVSQALRAGLSGRGDDRIGADLIGADLAGADLHGISLRGAYLIGADLRGADLRGTDLLGADLRDADLRRAQLVSSIFLTQPQLQAARGDTVTSLPAWASRPAHWQPTDLLSPRRQARLERPERGG